MQKNLPLRRRHCPKQAEQVFFLFDRRQCSIFFRICRRTDNIIRRHLKIVCHIPYHMYIRRAPAVNIVSKAFRSNKQIIGDLLTAFRMSFYKRSNSFCHCHFITFRYWKLIKSYQKYYYLIKLLCFISTSMCMLLPKLLTSSCTLHRRKFRRNSSYISTLTFRCYFVDW